MNFAPRNRAPLPPPEGFGILDAMLADLVVRIQLPMSQHRVAEDRYQTMRDWIDRVGSPLQHLVELMYPQGSMATGTTIARYCDKDEFDIDIMVELSRGVGRDPGNVLGILFKAIRGEKGSRYYDCTTLNTRCVTVHYADMHLDLTPAIRNINGQARECEIFHHKPGAIPPDSKLVPANPFGFAEWFKHKTPAEADFAKYFSNRSVLIDRLRAGNLVTMADGESVPAPTPFYAKSKAVVILQLLKRWRNVRYDKPDRRDRRRPPSILLAKLIADNAALFTRTPGLADTMISHVVAIRDKLSALCESRLCIREVNPVYAPDILTDRWPGEAVRQVEFLADLNALLVDLKDLRDGKHDLNGMRAVLGRLFGEKPANAVTDDYRDELVKRAREGGLRFSAATGSVAAPTIFPSSSASAAIPKHNIFGGD